MTNIRLDFLRFCTPASFQSYSSGFLSHSSGFLSHSSGFQWIPPESGHSCRNVRGSDKYCVYPLLQQTSIIIWDEVLMQHKYAIEAVNRTIQDLLENDSPFGGDHCFVWWRF